MALIDDAIAAGTFMETRRQHYERLMASDPEGTRRLIASLEPGLAPLTEHPRRATGRHRFASMRIVMSPPPPRAATPSSEET